MLEVIKAFHEGFKGSIGDKIFNMNKGVRQGCVLGPLLFNIVFDTVLKRAILNGLSGGAKMTTEDGSCLEINRLAYADDLCLIDTDWNNLIRNLILLNDSFVDLGLKININKTKVMNLNGDTKVLTAGHQLETGIEWVSKFVYLGSTISSNGTAEDEIRERIQKGTKKIRDLKPVLRSSKLSLRNKKKIVSSCILPVVYYSCESWRTGNKTIKKLAAFHNLCTRTIMKVQKTERIQMDTIDIGLPLPMDIIASRRLAYHSRLDTSDTPNIVRCVWRATMSMGKKISGRKKQALSECLRVDIQWLFGDSATYEDFIHHIVHRDPTVEREQYINSLIREGKQNRTRADLPKLLNERDKLLQCTIEGCFKEFAEQKELNRHLKRDHTESTVSIPLQLPQDEKPFKCTKCSKGYKTKGWFTRHLRKDHRIEVKENINEHPTESSAQSNRRSDNPDRDEEPTLIQTTDFQSATVTPTISTVVEQTTYPEDTHLSFRIADPNARGKFKCPFRGCTKSTNTAKGMLNHGTTIHDWSFATGKPKKFRRLKHSVPVGGLSGGS